MTTTDKLPFPPNLPPLPEPPAGHEWVFRGYGVKIGTSYDKKFSCHVDPDYPSYWYFSGLKGHTDGLEGYAYAEAVPLPAEPDFASRDYQKSIWIAAFEGSDCGFCMDGVWFDKADHSEIADAIMRGNKVRLTPTKKRIPLTAEDIPAVCWLKSPSGDISMITSFCEGDPCGPTFAMTFEALMDDGWEYSPDRRNFKPCYVEVEG